jgi:hypothetical protein
MRKLLTISAVSTLLLIVAGLVPGLAVASSPTLSKFENTFTNEDGSPDTLAGSHPFAMTTTIVAGTKLTKDIHIDFPAGFVANTNVVAQCPAAEFDLTLPEHFNACATNTVIGVAFVGLNGLPATVPVFNLVPSPGEPIRIGFEDQGVPVTIDTSVRTGEDYGADASISNIQQLLGFEEAKVTIWGIPGEPVHNGERGWECKFETEYGREELEYIEKKDGFPPCEPGKQSLTPFLTLPSACAGPSGLTATATADTWLEPGVFPEKELSYTPAQGLGGCNRERFEPQIKVAPDGQQASTPTGLAVDVHESQQGALSPTGTSASDVKDISVTLPEGVVLNPAGADGLQACSEGLIGYLPGQQPTSEPQLFTPEEQSCPNAAKIGEVTITTPLLPNKLTGAVYLASQNENPFGSLIAMYIVARDPVSGVLVKIPGEVTLDPGSGQITATIKDSPQLPFEDAELHFFGGARAPLATPAHCGTYMTAASFVPWAESPAVGSSSYFKIESGPNGSACPGSALPFGPSLTAGSTNINAGAFSPLTTTITREDGQQNIDQVTLHMPPGLSGVLTGVPLCGEAQANAGTCSQASLIGHTVVSVGLGGDPYTVTGGEVFLTEKYGGGQFGLSIVNPAVAGPFNLGKVIVRASINVDPHTAQLTVTTGVIPHILDGIPLQIKHINVTIDRSGFTFNPTNCNAQGITGSIGSVEGAAANVSDPFQVTNCATLKFAPKFAVSTAGATTRSKGASLKVKLTYPTGAGYANIKSVKVDLPKQLPSRLTTLQKACLAKVFETNPANCPKESIVGQAKAITPILPVPLEGPAYFVSYGNEKFPALIVVLQGYGVTVDLVGTTFISHAGITSSTFKTVPDVPVGTFELTLPTGKFSALAANLPTKARSSFCGQTLAMPTAFTAQNGLEIHESTKIGVTGCSKKATKKKTAKKKSAKSKKRK